MPKAVDEGALEISDGSLELNDAARGVLAEYLARTDPRYALLIDAPWGAGKTYFVRRETSCDENKDRLYVSLYGVKTAEEFDWALVRALKPALGGKSGKWATQAKNFVSGLQVAGFSMDLNKVSMTEIALSSLPDTIIFDDLERCRIAHDELFGLINRFVEHQRKKVILVANSEMHPDKVSYDKTREKLIGRIVFIEADPEAAISSFWQDLGEGAGKTYLQGRQSLLIEVFKEAGHNNLRIFRQSLVDAARLVDIIEPTLRQNAEPTERLLRTYLALSMAFASGEISIEDLKERANISLFTQSEEAKSKINIIQDRHPGADIQGYHNPILPIDLAVDLIGRGHASSSRINSQLEGTYYFAEKAETPDWIRLWRWGEELEVDLAALLGRTDKALAQDEVTVPGELLQIFGAKAFLQSFGGLPGTSDELADEFINIIGRLSEKALLPAFEPQSARRGGYGYSTDGDTVRYGGYGFAIDKPTRRVVDALMAAQDARFEQLLPGKAQELLRLLKEDKSAFIAAFEYLSSGQSFAETPILHHIEPKKFAAALLEQFVESLEGAAKIGDCIKERRKGHRRDLAAEHIWFEEMVGHLLYLGKARGQILGAQIALFVRRHLAAG